VVRVNRTGGRAFNNLGLAQLTEGKERAALASFEQALRLDPSSIQAAANLITHLENLGDLDRATTICQRVLAQHPQNPLLLSLAGRVQLQQGNYQEARSLLEKVTQLPEGTTGAANTWARDLGISRLKTGDIEGARAILTEALGAHPEDPSLWTNLGLVHLAREDPPAAETVFRRAVALPGASPAAQQNLAVSLHLQGKFVAAARHLLAAARANAPVPVSFARAIADSLLSRTPLPPVWAQVDSLRRHLEATP
jgi:Flp pilus assembly protein TadD